MGVITGLGAFAIAVFALFLAILWTVLPFAVFQMREQSIKQTQILQAIADHLADLKALSAPSRLPPANQSNPTSSSPPSATTQHVKEPFQSSGDGVEQWFSR
ncbi:hypothetical protein NP603_13830 [Methylomonas sp. SURF-1]|uniref:Uncharacterized protein n=1 Tax=Methylomonas aurea TaxID=2952224 RepID=A0ABT1UIY3_9GAMM|nr:hypothetical protein [Methylomonas sp. SURF-1]MCQ8182197.1 hypothetical protein [Methylomonas sp. SURF-1]